MSTVMTAPDFSSDPQRDLIRRIIDARGAYERLCGLPTLYVHVNGVIRSALEIRVMKPGSEVAGMRIIASPESIADVAICSRDAELFKPLPAPSPARGRAKK